MKKLKKVLSILLIIPVMFLFVACGGDPEEPSGGNGGSQGTELSLSVSDSFVMSKDLIDDFFLGYEEDDLLKDEYSNTMKKDANILKAVADIIPDYTPLYWHYGVEVAAGESEVNKLEKFYIDDASNDDEINVEISMLFTYDGLNKDYSYKFYCFNVEVDKETNEFVVKCFCEESFVKGTNNSTAKYHSFEIAGVFGDSKEIRTLNYYTFDRDKILAEPSTADNNTIKNFEGCKITKGQDSVFYLKENSDSNLAKENSVQTTVAREVASKTKDERTLAGIALMLIENGSSLLCPLVNA